jgi:hypothetical protein
MVLPKAIILRLNPFKLPKSIKLKSTRHSLYVALSIEGLTGFSLLLLLPQNLIVLCQPTADKTSRLKRRTLPWMRIIDGESNRIRK